MNAEATKIKKKKKPRLVEIEWCDSDSTWPWFWLLQMRGEWLHLQGADYPDGSAKHEGTCFWVHKSDVRRMYSTTKINSAPSRPIEHQGVLP